MGESVLVYFLQMSVPEKCMQVKSDLTDSITQNQNIIILFIICAFCAFCGH